MFNSVKIIVTAMPMGRPVTNVGVASFTVVRYNGFAPDETTEQEVFHANLRRFIRAEKKVGLSVLVVRP